VNLLLSEDGEQVIPKRRLVARARTELVSSEVVQYEDSIRLCYIRGPEGLHIGLAEQTG
jgi:hypothetical protein